MFKKAPDAMILIAVIMVFFIALTWWIPAGSYERIVDANTGRTVIDPDSFSYVDPSPQSWSAFFTAPLKGFEKAAEIIGFILFVGGAFALFNRTGSMDAGLKRLLKYAERHKNSKKLIVALLMIFFSFAGATFGMSEETLVFVLITLPLARSMGYDNLTGVAIPFLGAGVGFAGAFINPFTVQIAQGIAELPLTSGMGFRFVVWGVFTLLATAFILWYTAKLDKNPEYSPVYGRSYEGEGEHMDLEDAEFNNTRKIILVSFLVVIALLIIGVNQWGWYIVEISGLFIAFGIFSAVAYRLSGDETVKVFRRGAAEMLPAAIIVGMSRGLLVIAEDGQIIDTILYSVAGSVENLPNYISVQVMFLVQGFINFFIPSGSGQAALTMPIMAPLSDVLHISRQTAVLAYQFGDGIFNLIIPTSGVTMGILQIGNIPFNIWLKWMRNFMILLVLCCMGFLALSVMIGWN